MKTICPFCGVGCGIEVSGNRVMGADHITNRKSMCIKASILPEIREIERLTSPMINSENVEWNKATNYVADKIKSKIKKYGKNAVGFYIGAQIPTEDQYVATKLGKGIIGTGVFDSNVRLCMSSAASSLKFSLGIPLPTADYDDIDEAENFVLIGVNPASNFPVLWNRILKRRNREKAKVVVIDPVITESAESADIYVQIRPGTDLILISSIASALIENGDADFSELEGKEEFINFAKRWYPSKASMITGVPEETIRDLAKLLGRKTLFMWGMGVNQTINGTDTGIAIITLAKISGNLYGNGRGILPLTGQHNSMGAREVGALAGMLPGYRYVDEEGDAEFVEDFWGVPRYTISRKYWTITDLHKLVEERKIKLLWIIATNPVVSVPEIKRFKDALSYIDTVIVQDVYMTETAAEADVILPAAGWGERDGICTSGDKTVSYLSAIGNPPGETKPDWLILSEIGVLLGAENMKFSSTYDIFQEMKEIFKNTILDLKDINYSSLKDGHRREFIPGKVKTKGFSVDLLEYLDNNSFNLITIRLSTQWNTTTKTGKSWKLNMLTNLPRDVLMISLEDAKELKLKDGDFVKVRSRENCLLARVKVSKGLQRRVLYMPFHWGLANALMDWKADPISKEPAFKQLYVTLHKPDEN